MRGQAFDDAPSIGRVSERQGTEWGPLVTNLVTNQAPSIRTEPHNPERTSAQGTLKRHYTALSGQPFVG
jgi:hypothetical protein